MSQRQKQLVETFNTLSQDRIQLENNILQFLNQNIIFKVFNPGKNILVLNFQHLILRQGNFKHLNLRQNSSINLILRRGNFKNPVLGQDRSKYLILRQNSSINLILRRGNFKNPVLGQDRSKHHILRQNRGQTTQCTNNGIRGFDMLRTLRIDIEDHKQQERKMVEGDNG